RGRRILSERLAESALPIGEFPARVAASAPMRVKGTAVYLTRDPNFVPHALVLNLHHNKVLHERIVFLGIFTEAYAYVSAADRVQVDSLSSDMFRVTARYGFAEGPEVLGVIERCRQLGL